MMYFLLTITTFFWLLLLFYSLITLGGLWYRIKFEEAKPLDRYPSVAVLIPAHNEGLVLEDTLRAMLRLEYPGPMDIYVLADNCTDNTGEIADRFSSVFANVHHVIVPAGEPKGKSRVLNHGLSITDSEYFIVYDADNQPEPQSLRRLMENAESIPDAAGAVGYVKTINSEANALTRMISLEFQVFQLLMQCGRWGLFKLGSLAGTNMLLKRQVLEELGGYDPFALAEDGELTIRITVAGYKLPVVPTSVTWEQEPEHLKIFIRQRIRWLIGNLYMLEKSFRDISQWKGRTFLLTLQHVLTYFVFLILLLVSDIFFIASLAGADVPHVQSPLLLLWFMSYVVYTSQLLSAIVIDKNVTPINVLFIIIMYFTYAQLFVILLTKSAFQYIGSRIRGETIAWDKTKRFKKGEARS